MKNVWLSVLICSEPPFFSDCRRGTLKPKAKLTLANKHLLRWSHCSEAGCRREASDAPARVSFSQLCKTIIVSSILFHITWNDSSVYPTYLSYFSISHISVPFWVHLGKSLIGTSLWYPLPQCSLCIIRYKNTFLDLQSLLMPQCKARGGKKKKNLLLIYHTEVASLQNNLHMIAGKLHLATKRTRMSGWINDCFLCFSRIPWQVLSLHKSPHTNHLHTGLATINNTHPTIWPSTVEVTHKLNSLMPTPTPMLTSGATPGCLRTLSLRNTLRWQIYHLESGSSPFLFMLQPLIKTGVGKQCHTLADGTFWHGTCTNGTMSYVGAIQSHKQGMLNRLEGPHFWCCKYHMILHLGKILHPPPN